MEHKTRRLLGDFSQGMKRQVTVAQPSQRISARTYINFAYRLFSKILLHKEVYSSIFNISGERCWLDAFYLNGMVNARVSLGCSNKRFTIDFLPMHQFATKPMMFLEI